ncbi:MAG: protein phosphatase 2C domain-containing protein [Lachnospiraceae bacterium]|nr:protein phosphatase 2C domain-containing protein [Lachnospiraceae bacterium]
MTALRKTRFKDKLDTIFLINQDIIENCGEDSYYCAYSKSSAIISVFDGCGGLGSRTYQSFKGHTGAYMASRVVSGAVHDWYHTFFNTEWTSRDQLIDSINHYFTKAYDICSARELENLRIRGSMVRDYPTTAAIALAEDQDHEISVHVLWAGDSRVYFLDSRGLAQITEDDTDSEDAMDNLFSDGVLTNLLSSDRQYEIHYKNIKIDRPTVVFAATDGCFGYIPTPMEFEYYLLKTMLDSENPQIFRHQLHDYFAEYAGDDFTFGFMSFFYGSYEAMGKSFKERVKEMEREYICRLGDERNEKDAAELWRKYKPGYERHMNHRKG